MTITAPTIKPLIPDVPTPRDRDVRWELAAALRHFGRLGYEFGFNGHVSARAPEAPGHYWVNPFGISIDTVTPADFVLVDSAGEVTDGRGAHSINGFSGNLQLHEDLDDAAVVVHLHTPHGFAWSSLGEPLKAWNTDAALVANLTGSTSIIAGLSDSPTNLDEARDGKRILLQHSHGFVTWGSTVGEAAFYLWAAERAAWFNLTLHEKASAQELAPDLVAKWTLTPELARAHFEPAFTIAEADGLR